MCSGSCKEDFRWLSTTPRANTSLEMYEASGRHGTDATGDRPVCVSRLLATTGSARPVMQTLPFPKRLPKVRPPSIWQLRSWASSAHTSKQHCVSTPVQPVLVQGTSEIGFVCRRSLGTKPRSSSRHIRHEPKHEQGQNGLHQQRLQEVSQPEAFGILGRRLHKSQQPTQRQIEGGPVRPWVKGESKSQTAV